MCVLTKIPAVEDRRRRAIEDMISFSLLQPGEHLVSERKGAQGKSPRESPQVSQGRMEVSRV